MYDNNLSTSHFSPEEPESKKRVSPIVIILSVVVLLLAGIALTLMFMLPKDQTPKTPTQQPQAPLMDVSEYTDVVLDHYQELNVSVSEGDEQEGLVPGVVTYSRVVEGGSETMNIVNKKSLSEQQQEEYFQPAYDEIMNRNTTATWFDAGEPWVLTTTALGSPRYNVLTEIQEVDYPNTDHTLAILSLAHGQENAGVEEASGNYQIFVFALKGDNIIRLASSIRNIQQDFEIPQEEHDACIVPVDGELDTNTYDVECISQIFQSGLYNSELQNIANLLILSFAISPEDIDTD